MQHQMRTCKCRSSKQVAENNTCKSLLPILLLCLWSLGVYKVNKPCYILAGCFKNTKLLFCRGFFSVVDAVLLFIPHLLVKGHLCYPRMKLSAVIVMDASENNYLSSRSCCFSIVSGVVFPCCVAGFDT